MADPKTLAGKLKDEGNTFFARKDYRSAHTKYSEALKVGDQNAVLYMDAIGDAIKATEIDPKYAKGWARLAAAQSSIGSDERCIENWKKAIKALPEDGPTEAETKQKTQYEAELKAAEEKLRKLKTAPVQGLHSRAERAPWIRAQNMEEELRARGDDLLHSSAVVIAAAYAEWKRGMDIMKAAKSTPSGVLMGMNGAIEALSNAILRDDRIFHLSESNFIEMYNRQVRIEAQSSSAWVEGGPQIVEAEAIRRQQTQGWDACRRAITTTVRLWIMRGFMEDTIRQRHDVALEFIGRAREVLQWGIQTWSDVPQEDKGAIFTASFLQGVHSLYLDSYMKAYGTMPSKSKLETLRKEAQALLDSPIAENVLLQTNDPGFMWAFTRYPRGRALSMIGFYHVNTAKRLAAQNPHDVDAILQHYRDAADAYLEAAEKYPKDDEQHLWFINNALQSYFICGTPLSTTLPLLERVRLGLPNMKKIWEFSALCMVAIKTFDDARWVEDECRKGLQKGKLTLESNYIPDALKSQVPKRR